MPPILTLAIPTIVTPTQLIVLTLVINTNKTNNTNTNKTNNTNTNKTNNTNTNKTNNTNTHTTTIQIKLILMQLIPTILILTVVIPTQQITQ